MTDQPMTERQARAIDTLRREVGWDADRLAAFLAERNWRYLTLTKRQATSLIGALIGIARGDRV